MSAHGIPGAFSSALSLFFRWMLIALVAVLVLTFVTKYLPWFNQDNIKSKLLESQNDSKKSSLFGGGDDPDAFNFYDPKTWTYDAMINRNSKMSKDPSYNIAKPILMPTIDQYSNGQNNNVNSYIMNTYKENTTQNEWYTDGAEWNN